MAWKERMKRSPIAVYVRGVLQNRARLVIHREWKWKVRIA